MPVLVVGPSWQPVCESLAEFRELDRRQASKTQQSALRWWVVGLPGSQVALL